jgi:ubiquinone/menaquinone biosynthesis C-methylase UbiE
VTAVEPSEAMREEGIRRSDGAGIAWYPAMAESLPFDDGAFDGALFFASLEFIDGPGQALLEARRVVRSGGWIVAAILDSRSPWAALYRSEASRGQPPWNAATFFEPSELEELIGLPHEATDAAIYLGPDDERPFDEADARARDAGGYPSLSLVRWRNP